MNTQDDHRDAADDSAEAAETADVSESGSDEESPPPPDGLRSRFLKALYYWTLSRM